MRKTIAAIIISLGCVLPCASQESGTAAGKAAKPFSLSGRRGLSGDVALLIEQYGTDANIRYSFTAPVELGAMAGLGPFILPPFEESIYRNMSFTYGLLMAKAGAFVRLPFSILPWLVLTPELSGAVRWEFQYARARSERYGFDRTLWDAPWVLEADLKIELDVFPARAFGFKPLGSLAIRLGLETPLAHPTIMYDRERYYIGLAWAWAP